MNEHMSEHTISLKRTAFTGFDMEMSYLLDYKTVDFQTVCQNRIIKTLTQQPSIKIEKKLGKVLTFTSVHDEKIVHPQLLCYQAWNLIYMFALWLVDSIDEDLIKQVSKISSWVEDIIVDNTSRWTRNDGTSWDEILTIFSNVIWMHDFISLENIEELRAIYKEKRGLADEIVRQWREYNLKLNSIRLLTEKEKTMAA